jgi:hypothetical protein
MRHTEKSKKKNRRWDAILVSIGMTIGFCIIVMKITGYWPCHLINVMHIQQVSCDKSIPENVSSITNWLQHVFSPPRFSLQILQST